jgi:hypothetical protein
MTSNLIVTNKKKESQSPLQKTFHSLKKRIEILRKDCIECTKALDRHLEFYDQMLLPQERQITLFLREEIKLFSPYLKKQLKKQEKAILKQIIEDMFEKISTIEGPDMLLDEELSKIFEEMFGFSFQEERSSGFEEFKQQMEAKFAKQGVDIDLTDIKMEGSLDEAIADVMESMMEQGAFFEENPSEAPRVKTKKELKKELKKEQKALELAALQKKEIGPLYKQLAKACHPDLETDPILKLEKEALMKRITSAYEARDLHALLALELEIILADDPEKKVRSEDQLKVYNDLLQTQIVEIQGTLHRIPMEFKYAPLGRYVAYQWKKGDFILDHILKELYSEITTHKKLMEECEKGNALQLIRKAIKERQFLNSLDNDY